MPPVYRAPRPREFLTVLCSTFVLGLCCLAEVHSVQDDQVIRTLLDQAKQEQTTAAKDWKAFHDFQFSDRQPESGLTFLHRMTEDSGRREKPVHYDHGSGLAAGDVDSDGRTDLYFANQVGGNELWRNLGQGKFENITAAAGVGVTDRVSMGAAFADLDNDGDPDLIVSAIRRGNVLFENLGGGRFREASEAAGFNSRFHSSGIVVFDYNRDGRLDVLITSLGKFTADTPNAGGHFTAFADAFSGHLFPERNEPPVLYRNDGGLRFTEVAQSLNLRHAGWNGDATACDVNDDGFLDLYLLNMQGDDRLMINLKGERFEEQTARYFPKTPWGAMGVAVFDFNLDGRQDFLITDMHSDMTGGQIRLRRSFNAGVERSKSEAWCTAQWNEAFLQGSTNNIFGNAFYQNLGDGKFAEVSDRVGLETFWPWGATVADFNADGFEDVFVTAGMGYPFAYSINSLLLNEAGTKFHPAEFVVGVEPRRDGRVSKESFTLDLDGADKDHPLRKGRTGKLSVRGSLSSRSSAAFDLDDDGDLDLVTNEFDDVPQVLVSDLASRKRMRFLKLKLVGRRSNRDGLGAVVRVRAGDKTYVRQHFGKSGYLGQSSLPLYFGLGATTKADSIEIIWPSGTRQTLQDNLPEDSLLVVTEPTTQ